MQSALPCARENFTDQISTFVDTSRKENDNMEKREPKWLITWILKTMKLIISYQWKSFAKGHTPSK